MSQLPNEEKDMRSKDHHQNEYRTVSTRTLLTDELLKAFKDKQAKTQQQDLKAEKSTDHLFKDNLSRFKDDLSNIFKFGFSVEKEKKKDSKITDGDNRKEEQPDCGFRETLSQQDNDNSAGHGLNQPEHNQLDPNASEQTREVVSPRRRPGNHVEPKLSLTVAYNQEDHNGAKMKDQTEPPEDWLKGVKDQDKELPSTQTEEKPSTLRLLKEDASFRFTSSLLTHDCNVFTFKLSKKKDKDDSSKIKVFKSERTEDPLKNLLKRDQSPCLSVADRGEVEVELPQRKEEELDCGFRQSLSENNKDETERSNNDQTPLDKVENKSEARQEVIDTSHTTRTPGFFKTLFRKEQNLIKTCEEPEASGRVQNPHSGQQLDKSAGDGLNHELGPNGPEAKETMSRGKPAVLIEEPSHGNNHRQSELHDQENHEDEDRLKTNHGGKRTSGSLTLFKEDFDQFREDLLNVFRIRPLKEKYDKVQNAEINKKPVGSKTKPDDGHRINFPEQNNKTLITKTMNNIMTDTTNQPEGSKLDTVSAAKDADPEREDGPSGLHCESGIGLFSPRCMDTIRPQLGDDLCSLKNFATYLTFDPNTASSELRLTNGNRKATRVRSEQPCPDHPERFLHCPQVLGREGLLDLVYWEVEWSGGADVGVAYNSISRDGDAQLCVLGHNTQSWSLECSEGSYTPTYNHRRLRSSSPEPFTHRVGLYLDWSAGTLSFYCVSQDAMVHLHTFTSTFTEPLYAGFWIWAPEGSVSLCQAELKCERLQ